MSKAEWNLEVKEGNVNKKNRKANYRDKILKKLFPLDSVCELFYLIMQNEKVVFHPKETFFSMHVMSFA